MTSASSASVAPSSVPGGQRSVVATAPGGQRSVVATWRATLRRCHHTWRATLRRCHRRGGMTSASSASVAPSTPCTRSARLVKPLHSLRSFAQAPHSLRSFGQSLRSTVRAIAVMRSAKADPPPAAPGRLFVVPPTSGHLALLPSLRSGLRPSPRCRATSASLSKAQAPARHPLHTTVPAASLTLAPLPASQRLSSYLARRFLLVNGYARSFAGTVAISYRYLQLDISLDQCDNPSVSCADYPYSR